MEQFAVVVVDADFDSMGNWGNINSLDCTY